MRRLNLFVIALVLAMPAAAEIYQWRDAQGQIHYSDTPPPGQNATKIPPAPKPPTKVTPNGDAAPTGGEPKAGEPAKPKTVPERELEFRQRRAAAAEATAKAEQERLQSAERQRTCERARAQLAALEGGQRMSRYGIDGERIVLDDAGRAEEIERTRGFVESTCK